MSESEARLKRRTVLARLLALTGSVYLPSMPLGAFAQATAAAGAGGSLKRQALVLGNSVYRPERNAIPSARKNTVSSNSPKSGDGGRTSS